MLADAQLTKAVSSILQRSERQTDVDKLIGTFVDIGVLPQLNNSNNQIVFGRRGTGKTHVLKVLQSAFESDSANTVLYIDARTLGSTSQFSDPAVPIKERCLSLFRDILSEIYNALLVHIVNAQSANGERALEELDNLRESFAESQTSLQAKSVTAKDGQTTTRGTSASVALGGKDLASGNLGATRTTSGVREVETTYAISPVEKVVFPSLHGSLSRVLELAGTRLYVLLDEWSSLPLDIQPYLAEFLKRGLLANSRAVLKIAALEYRSNFGRHESGGILGFELGSDIAAGVDLDDYYVFDRNPTSITNTFADVLFRHISSELPDDYLRKQHRVSDGRDLASRLFTERETFIELVRSSEGVVRDLINIFSTAYFNAARRGRDSIDRKAILEAARQWFEQDKARNLDEELQLVLRDIVDRVIGSKRARSFLLPRNLEQHPVIQRLFDARVVHHVQRGYADKNNPGVRYNIYSLDYGTYVDLINTSKQPTTQPAEGASKDDEFDVPLDDKRSIRSIVLNETILAPASAAPGKGTQS